MKFRENKIGNSIKWSFAGEALAKLMVPISNMILARILIPEDFGILAAINMIITFVDLFTDSGFSKYIIQNDFESDKEYLDCLNVAFITNLVLSILFWIAIFVFKDGIAQIVGCPGYGNVIAIASIQLIITAFSSIQSAVFKRAFDFRTVFVSKIVMVIVPLVITVPLAIVLKNYWSLIIGSTCAYLFSAIVLTIKSEWKPRFFYSFHLLKKMFSFSAWSLAEALSYWTLSWFDVFIIGSSFTAYYLGLYKNSINMVNSVMALVKATIIPVLFSALARMKDDKSIFENVYYSLQRLAACLLIPMGVGLFIFRNLVTAIIFGAKWMSASNIVGAWALASCFLIVFTSFNAEAYKAKGIPKVLFISDIISLLIIIPVCVYYKQFGFWYLVYARSLSVIVQIVVGMIFMRRFMRFSLLEMISNNIPPLISTLVMGALGMVLQRMAPNYWGEIAAVLVCIIVYFAVLWILFKKKIITDISVLQTNQSIDE